MLRIVNHVDRKEIRRDLRKNQTLQEKILWDRLRNNQTSYKWKRQVSIGPFVADFYCWKKLLVIELDGAQHKENKEYDSEREEYFKTLGIKTLRFWNNEIEKNIENVIKVILEELAKSPLPSPLLSGEGSER